VAKATSSTAAGLFLQPLAAAAAAAAVAAAAENKAVSEQCDWCRRPDSSGGRFRFQMSNGGGVRSVCSERCMTLFRRAAFKRARNCEWCRRPMEEGKKTMTLAEKDVQLHFCK